MYNRYSHCNLSLVCFFKACFKGHAGVAALLLDRNADVDLASKDGDTPLVMASYNGHADVVKALIGAKADLNKEDGGGKTPLHWATRRGHGEVAALLRAAGAK